MKNELGEIAMGLIADHPLYASTSGITYPEAIAIAKIVFGPDLKAVKAENDRIEGLSMEELGAELRAKGLVK
jgi:hypothetical protein